mmetsp:Transcript_58541/g.152385  ORF Transcript_58541/g.152385 Transcript_58541/m.152385 type:complete len:117 (+) Transcript_58541:1323-1673(+)
MTGLFTVMVITVIMGAEAERHPAPTAQPASPRAAAPWLRRQPPMGNSWQQLGSAGQRSAGGILACQLACARSSFGSSAAAPGQRRCCRHHSARSLLSSSCEPRERASPAHRSKVVH